MIILKHIHKYYGYTHILDDISMTFNDHGFYGITGPSGCGKSTLLHLLAGIDSRFDGELIIDGDKVQSLSDHFRVSMIFQDFNLIGWLSVRDNCCLYDYFHRSSGPLTCATEAFQHTPVLRLSLGQRQIVSCERASHPLPEIILADEPTASLDSDNGHQMMTQLANDARHSLVIIVSHDQCLLEQYCDTIYYMQDGMIVDVKKLQTSISDQAPVPIKSHCSLTLLTLKSLKNLKSYSLQMVSSLSLSLLCLMLTLSLSFSFKMKVNDVIDSLLPTRMISFKLHENDTYESIDFSDMKEIKNVFVYADDIELLGLSFDERYQSNQALAISDETDTVTVVTYGQLISSADEIVLPLSTALRLNDDVKSLIGQTVYIHYKYGRKVKGYPVTIVGISPQQLSYTAFYQQQGASWQHLKVLFDASLRSSYGIIHYAGKTAKVLEKLKVHYPDYEFKAVGDQTKAKASHMIDQIQMVLGLFAGLTMLASLCLLIEMTILNAQYHIKDYAIMMCYGAKKRHLIFQVIVSNIILYATGALLSLSLYCGFLMLMNEVLIPLLLDLSFYIAPSFMMMAKVYGITFIFVLTSSLTGVIKVMHMDTVDALKQAK